MKDLGVKTRAWAAHLLISFAVLLPVFLVIFLIWFPAPFFWVMSTAPIVAVMIGVDLVLGPILTFVVYRPKKKGLKFDLTVIAAIQVIALVYGLVSIHSERPSYVVFAVDRYVPLAEKDIDFARAGVEPLGDSKLGHVNYVFAELPMGQAFQDFQNSVIFGGQPDLERRPEFWRDFAVGRDAILASAKPLPELIAARPGHSEALLKAAERAGLEPDTALFVPIVGKREDFAGLLDPGSAEIIDAVLVNPWLD